ncbi:MAG: Fic family protein [Luteolibacter sp.]
MRPPFEITPLAAALLAKIERHIGRYEGARVSSPNPMLRRSLRVRTIQASLAIEGNTLSEEQVTAVLEGKKVIAPERDLREVKNAITCYERMVEWNPSSQKHLLAAHKIMTEGLLNRPGAWRSSGVGIVKGKVISHIAPPADRVPGLVKSLFGWMQKEKAIPAPIKAAVCHYELEFIHPFADGNGRMGRLWHSLILSHHHPLFSQIPIESSIRNHQANYYDVLGRCDKLGNSTAFIEFSLELTLDALAAVTALPASTMTAAARMENARSHFATRPFSRKDYLAHFPGLSPATASRDLQQAIVALTLTREGNKATTRYWFKES